jgi:hypothetical protein
MSENEITLDDEALRRVLALREARSLLTVRRSVSGGPFTPSTHVENEMSPVDLVTVASWIVTGIDPWDETPAREQVELEAQVEALQSSEDDGDLVWDRTEGDDDPEPTPTEARIGDFVSRTAGTEIHAALERERHDARLQEQEEIARESTAVTSQVDGHWSPGGLDATETIPAVPAAEPTFDQVLGASDQQDRRAWS